MHRGARPKHVLTWSVALVTASSCTLSLDFDSLSSQYSPIGTGGGGGATTTGGMTRGGEGGMPDDTDAGDSTHSGAGGAGAGVGGMAGTSGDTHGGAGATNGGAGSGGGGMDAGGSGPKCENGQVNSGETDADCGGGGCPLCDNDKMCRSDSNCLSDRCVDQRCQPATCEDNRRNNNETDIDCGGPDECDRCAPGDACELNRDCSSTSHSTTTCGDDDTCVRVCDADYDDCSDPSDGSDDGCEAHLLSDPNHCTGCGMACDDTNGTPICDMGTCDIACDDGYDDCSGGVADGCETSLTTSEAHCGQCNRACAGGQSCLEKPVANLPDAAFCCRDWMGMPDNQLLDLDTACFTINPTTQAFHFQNQMGVALAYDAKGSCVERSGVINANGASEQFDATCDVTFVLWDAGRNNLLTNARVFWWNVMN